MKTELRPGFKTSEFWLCCGVQITAFLVALNAPDTAAKIVSGATALGAIIAYIYTRHQAKMQAAADALPPADEPRDPMLP